MAAVTIKVRESGPYKVTGPAVVTDGRGGIVADGDEDDVCILCRCGRTSSPPSCDGSHRR